MTDFTDVSQPTTSWASKDSFLLENPGFEDVTGDWPDKWVLTSGGAAQAGSKTGDPSDAQ